MDKIFISMPLTGKCQNDVDDAKKRLTDDVNEWLKENRKDLAKYEIVGGFDTPENPEATRLYYLGEAIKKLGECSICVFSRDWAEAPGCLAENRICEIYGIKKLYESRVSNSLYDATKQ